MINIVGLIEEQSVMMRDMARGDSIAVEIGESLCYAAVGGIGKLD